MKIRLTQERDLLAIAAIFAQGIERQHQEGNYAKWREDYPTVAVVADDIKQQRGFVCVADDDTTLPSAPTRPSTTTSCAARGAPSAPTK